MFVVDTNLLVYSANRAAPEHAQALRLVEMWRTDAEPWFLTWSIAYEFLRVTTSRRGHHQILLLPEAVQYLDALLASPVVGVLTETSRHAAILTELAGQHTQLSGNVVHDLQIAALMKEHGISEIRTADTDFHQFKFLRVVNPLT